jgi:hypothetical protein
MPSSADVLISPYPFPLPPKQGALHTNARSGGGVNNKGEGGGCSTPFPLEKPIPLHLAKLLCTQKTLVARGRVGVGVEGAVRLPARVRER